MSDLFLHYELSTRYRFNKLEDLTSVTRVVELIIFQYSSIVTKTSIGKLYIYKRRNLLVIELCKFISRWVILKLNFLSKIRLYKTCLVENSQK